MAKPPPAGLQLAEDCGDYASLVDAISKSQAIATFDLDGTILSANRNFLAAVGYALNEIQGKHHNLLVDADDRGSADHQRFWRILGNGDYQAGVYKRIRRDGTEMWFQATYNPVFGRDGKTCKIVMLATDITAQKLKAAQVAALDAQFLTLIDASAETKLRLFEGIVDNAPDTILITEAEPIGLPGPRIIYANPALTAMTGYSVAEVVGKTPRMFQGPLSGTETPARIRSALKSWQPVRAEMLNYRKDGTVFWVELSISPLCNKDGFYTHWISVQRDISVRKQLEEELRSAAERLTLATDSGSIGIWEWDVAQGGVVWDNRTRQLYDVDPADETKTYALWSDRLHPEDRSVAERELADAVAGKHRFDTSFRIIWRDGSVHHIRAIGELTQGAAGGALRMVGVNWDVTAQFAENLALKEATKRMQLAADGGEIGILDLDLVNNLMLADAWASRIFGMTHSPGLRVSGDDWSLRIHPEDRERRVRARQDAIDGIRPYAIEYRIIRDDGGLRHIYNAASVTRDEAGNALRLTGSVQDITARIAIEAELTEKAAESNRLGEALAAQNELLEVTLKSIGDAVVCTDVEGKITFSNIVADKLLGVAAHESKQPAPAEIARMIEACRQDAGSLPLHGAAGTMNLPADFTLTRDDGCRIAVEGCVAAINDRDHREAGKVIVFRDVSAPRAIAHQVRHMAHHDTLTGLPNRLLLSERIEQAINTAPRLGQTVGVLFVDLDGFKRINDSLGHAVGDKLLKSVSSRMSDCVRLSDTVSRQGGDEFVVLLAELSEPADAGILARRLLQVVGETHSIDGHELYVTASIGVSVYPDDGRDAETLIKAADTAMYKVKDNGRHGYKFFEPAMNAGAGERQRIEESLRQAIKDEEFVLHYQPKINIGTGAITGAEALIRWIHPERGSIAPALFIPVAEGSGLIRRLGAWVLREACKQGRRWIDEGLPPITISVNVSPIELGNSEFLDGVLDILRDTGFDPKYLELELTEGVLMKRAVSTDIMMKALKATGVRLAIDDFGTGYSSLSYLTKFPVDTIKIDQSFVRQISTDPTETAIVTAIISMAHSLNLAVVAEGVETREELEFLANLGCDEAQGYYFGRPVAAASFKLLFPMPSAAHPAS
jgi:diguanylate cyclase (GGDEF)-like protein/PAS domain S-box-containing protein